MTDNSFTADNSATVSRTTTGKRVLLTLLFVVVAYLLAAVLALVILFELVYALITLRRPHARVPRFAHRIVRYGFDIGQYATWNTEIPPFPFEELPNGADPVGVHLSPR